MDNLLVSVAVVVSGIVVVVVVVFVTVVAAVEVVVEVADGVLSIFDLAVLSSSSLLIALKRSFIFIFVASTAISAFLIFVRDDIVDKATDDDEEADDDNAFIADALNNGTVSLVDADVVAVNAVVADVVVVAVDAVVVCIFSNVEVDFVIDN